MDNNELKRLIGMLKLGNDLTSYAESKLMNFIKEQEAKQLILSGVVKSFCECKGSGGIKMDGTCGRCTKPLETE